MQQRPCRLLAAFVPSSTGASSGEERVGDILFTRGVRQRAGFGAGALAAVLVCFLAFIFLVRAVVMPPSLAVAGCPGGSGHGRCIVVRVRMLRLGGCRGRAAVGLIRERSHQIVITFCVVPAFVS